MWLEKYYNTPATVGKAQRWWELGMPQSNLTSDKGMRAKKLQNWYYLLADVGFPDNLALTGALSIMNLESRAFDENPSHVAIKDRNYAGIKYNPKFLPFAGKGTSAPEGGFYAKFANDKQFAKAFYKVLSINKGAGRPIDQKTIASFGNAIKMNGYSTDPKYYLKFNASLKEINDLIAWITSHADIMPQIDDGNFGKGGWWGRQPWYVKAGIIGGGGLVTIVLIKQAVKK